VVFITHNVRHALAVGDRFTVLNRGKTLGTAQRGQITPEELQDMMAGGQELVALERLAGRDGLTMEARDVADSLLVTEVFTPAGHWSSYPPHRHDEDDFPRITYLEETYYHRLNPADGFGIQRVFTEDGSLDETMAVHDHDLVLVPKGHHPCGAPYGVEMYYLNVMAGPRRNWRFQTHPAFERLMT
jgi:5-deoxy-glucuronate isomerase